MIEGNDEVFGLEKGHDFYLGREFLIVIRDKELPMMVKDGEISYIIKDNPSNDIVYKKIRCKLIGHEDFRFVGYAYRFRVIDIELVKVDNKL